MSRREATTRMTPPFLGLLVSVVVLLLSLLVLLVSMLVLLVLLVVLTMWFIGNSSVGVGVDDGGSNNKIDGKQQQQTTICARCQQ